MGGGRDGANLAEPARLGVVVKAAAVVAIAAFAIVAAGRVGARLRGCSVVSVVSVVVLTQQRPGRLGGLGLPPTISARRKLKLARSELQRGASAFGSRRFADAHTRWCPKVRLLCAGVPHPV